MAADLFSEFEDPTLPYLDARGDPCPRRHAVFNPVGGHRAGECCGQPVVAQFRLRMPSLNPDRPDRWYHASACAKHADVWRRMAGDTDVLDFAELGPGDPDFWVGPEA